MLNAVFVTVALLTLSPTPPPGQPSPRLVARPCRAPARQAPAHAAKNEAAPASLAHGAVPAPVAEGADATAPLAERLGVADPNALYSARARKRFAAYLRLRLLELREEHLSRAAEAIERHISVSTLLGGP